MQPTELPVDPSTDSGPRSIDSALSKRCLARNLVASASIPPRRSFLACLGRMLENSHFSLRRSCDAGIQRSAGPRTGLPGAGHADGLQVPFSSGQIVGSTQVTAVELGFGPCWSGSI